MREFGAFEAKNKLSELLDLVEQGEELVITRRGRAIARLVPNSSGSRRDEARNAAERIRARAHDLPNEFRWEEWKAMRDVGRP